MRTFLKFTYPCVDLDQLLGVSYEQLMLLSTEAEPAEEEVLTTQALPMEKP